MSKPIEIDTPELCHIHMLPLIRQGRRVVCANGEVIALTVAEYRTTYQPEVKTNRGHVRGHARGRHKE